MRSDGNGVMHRVHPEEWWKSVFDDDLALQTLHSLLVSSPMLSLDRIVIDQNLLHLHSSSVAAHLGLDSNACVAHSSTHHIRGRLRDNDEAIDALRLILTECLERICVDHNYQTTSIHLCKPSRSPLSIDVL